MDSNMSSRFLTFLLTLSSVLPAGDRQDQECGAAQVQRSAARPSGESVECETLRAPSGRAQRLNRTLEWGPPACFADSREGGKEGEREGGGREGGREGGPREGH